MKQRFRSRLTVPRSNRPGSVGFVLLPGTSLDVTLDIKARPEPLRRSLHIVAEHDIFGKLMMGDGYVFKQTYHRIDDSLECNPAPEAPELHCLRLSGAGEEWPREAYILVNPITLPKQRPLTFCVSVRGQGVRVDRGGELGVELGVYRRRKGRHAEDVSQPPDETIVLRLPEGTHSWQMLSETVRLPADTVMLLVRIGGKQFSGDVWIGSPRLFAANCETVIPPLMPHQPLPWKTSWTGINLSHKEWPRFSFALDNRVFFHRRIYLPGDHCYDFDVPVPMLAPGRHRLTVKLDHDYPERLPVRLHSVELLEESARPLEIVWHPEYVSENTPFPVLLESNTPKGSELIVRQVDAGAARSNPHYELSLGAERIDIELRRVVRYEEKPVQLGVGDIYCMAQTREAFLEYLVWYLENQQGNGIFFRSMYYSNGTRQFDPAAWRAIVQLINRIGLTYHYMEDGRNLNDVGINPPDALLKGAFYHGRQQHEQDWLLYSGHYCVNDPFENDLRIRFQVNCCRALLPVARRNGKAFLQDMEKVDDVRRAERCWLNTLRAFRGARGVTRHTGPSTLFRYFLKAGYDWVGAEQMYGPSEVTLASLRGASRAYGKKAYGTHLAHQWASPSHDSPEHAHRFFLALATSYMQGATEIDTEDGQYRISYGFDRFSHACRIHQQTQREFMAFINTHARRGTMRVPIAVFQGRHCGWMCFSRRAVWGSDRPEFAFGPAEESFDLLKTFYPRSVLNAIGANPCPNKPMGWYSGTPYGPVDLLPVEASAAVLRQYVAGVFLGWNTYAASDFRRLTHFMEEGGTLMLAKPHLATNLHRGESSLLPHSPELAKVLGNDWQQTQERRERRVGLGRVICYTHDCYPSDRRIRSAYERDLQCLGESVCSRERARGWIRGTDDVSFTVYDWDDKPLRTIYLLDIAWWSGRAATSATLLFGKGAWPVTVRRGRIEVVTLSENLAVQPDATDADVLNIQESRQQAVITIQSDRGSTCRVYRRDSLGRPMTVRATRGGVQDIVIPL